MIGQLGHMILLLLFYHAQGQDKIDKENVQLRCPVDNMATHYILYVQTG